MNTPDPAPAQPPSSMPWYRSPIIVSAVALIIVRILNHFKTAYHLDLNLSVFGIDANTAAEYVIDGIVGLCGWLIIRARAVQKHAPTIVLSPPKGDDMKKVSMLLIGAMAALLLNGCAILNSADTQAAQAVNTGIELAASGYIRLKAGSDPAAQQAVAVQLENISLSLEGVASGSLTVAQFNTQAAAWISTLSPTDKILAQGLLQQIDAYFATVLTNNTSLIQATTQAAAKNVLNDIIQACVANGAPPPPLAASRIH